MITNLINSNSNVHHTNASSVCVADLCRLVPDNSTRAPGIKRSSSDPFDGKNTRFLSMQKPCESSLGVSPGVFMNSLRKAGDVVAGLKGHVTISMNPLPCGKSVPPSSLTERRSGGNPKPMLLGPNNDT